MNGQGISLVGPNIPYTFIGGMIPQRIPYGGTTGLMTLDPVANRLEYYPGSTIALIAADVFGVTTTIGRLDTSGQFRLITTATAVTPYNIGNERVLLVTTGAGAFTVNLPTAVGRNGQQVIIKKVDAGAGAVTIDAAGAETIDGALTRVLAAQWNAVTLISDGANWVIVNSF